MLQPILTPSPRAPRLISPEECWRTMSRRASVRVNRRARGSSRSVGIPFPAQPGSLISHFDFSQAGTVTSSANKASAVSNLAGTGSGLVQATGASQPGYGLTTLNGRNTLNCSANGFMTGTIPAGVTDFTAQAVITIGAAVSGAYGILGNDAGGFVFQINAGVLRGVDYTAAPIGIAFADLPVTAASAHVVTLRRSGTTFDAFLDGTKTGSPGTVTANAIVTTWILGTDDTGDFDPFTGFFGETLFYGAALSDANILANRSALKALWGTP